MSLNHLEGLALGEILETKKAKKVVKLGSEILEKVAHFTSKISISEDLNFTLKDRKPRNSKNKRASYLKSTALMRKQNRRKKKIKAAKDSIWENFFADKKPVKSKNATMQRRHIFPPKQDNFMGVFPNINDLNIGRVIARDNFKRSSIESNLRVNFLDKISPKRMEYSRNRDHKGHDGNKSEEHLEKNSMLDLNSGHNVSGYMKEDSRDRRSEGLSTEKRGLKKRKKLTDK